MKGINRWASIASMGWMLMFAASVTAAQAAEATPAVLDLPDAPQATSQQATPQPSTPAPADDQQLTPEEKRKKAEEQLKEEEKQRVWAVVATFNTTANQQAIPLTPGEKFQLFFKSAFDPWPFLLASVLAGIGQAENDIPEYGQGVQGYAKRFGSEYGDYFIGNFLGNAVMASVLKEDPRYYQKGTGSFVKRALWAASGTVWCKRDNGTWGPNYANVLGNMSGAAISNVYYPASYHTVGNTIGRGASVTAQGIIGSEVIEFWPDIVRHHRKKQAEKLARQNGYTTDTQPPASSTYP